MTNKVELDPEQKDELAAFFRNNDFTEYTVSMYRRKDGRIYLKNLKQKGFTIRDFLVEFSSALDFEMGDDCFELRLIPFYI